MINLIDELTVYEVSLVDVDEDGNYLECVDSEFVLSPSYMDAEDVKNEYLLHNPEAKIENRTIEVYEARSATILQDRGQVDVTQVDGSTGCNGSPVAEFSFDENGQEIED